MREIEKLKREMWQEEEAIGLVSENGDVEDSGEVEMEVEVEVEGNFDGEFTPPPSPTPLPETIIGNRELDEAGLSSGGPSKDDNQSVHKKSQKEKSKSQTRLSDDVPAPSNTPLGNGDVPQDAAPSQPELTKREKRKLREAKKAVNPKAEGNIIVRTSLESWLLVY